MTLGAYVQGGMPGSLAEFATLVQGQWDVINAPLWSTETLTSSDRVVNFFTRLYADKVNGNVQMPGSMPAPYYYLVRALRLNILANVFYEAAADTTNLIFDYDKILNASYITIVIGNKDFGMYPTWMIPAGGGPWAHFMTAISGASAATVHNYGVVTNGWPDARNVFSLSKPLLIGPNQTFGVSLNTQSSGLSLSGPVNVQFVLDGEFFRPVQ